MTPAPDDVDALFEPDAEDVDAQFVPDAVAAQPDPTGTEAQAALAAGQKLAAEAPKSWEEQAKARKAEIAKAIMERRAAAQTGPVEGLLRGGVAGIPFAGQWMPQLGAPIAGGAEFLQTLAEEGDLEKAKKAAKRTATNYIQSEREAQAQAYKDQPEMFTAGAVIPNLVAGTIGAGRRAASTAGEALLPKIQQLAKMAGIGAAEGAVEGLGATETFTQGQKQNIADLLAPVATQAAWGAAGRVAPKATSGLAAGKALASGDSEDIRAALMQGALTAGGGLTSLGRGVKEGQAARAGAEVDIYKLPKLQKARKEYDVKLEQLTNKFENREKSSIADKVRAIKELHKAKTAMEKLAVSEKAWARGETRRELDLMSNRLIDDPQVRASLSEDMRAKIAGLQGREKELFVEKLTNYLGEGSDYKAAIKKAAKEQYAPEKKRLSGVQSDVEKLAAETLAKQPETPEQYAAKRAEAAGKAEAVMGPKEAFEAKRSEELSRNLAEMAALERIARAPSSIPTKVLNAVPLVGPGAIRLGNALLNLATKRQVTPQQAAARNLIEQQGAQTWADRFRTAENIGTPGLRSSEALVLQQYLDELNKEKNK